MSFNLKNEAGNAVPYTLYRVDNQRAVYHGEGHSDLVNDSVLLTATEPKKTRDSNGNRRSVTKVIQTVTVENPSCDTPQSKDAKIEILTSIPVGASTAQIGELLARGAEVLQTADIKLFALTGKIQF